MTALAWDQPGEKIFETGVDRGVLGVKDGPVVPWNGLISVEESPESELKAFYIDGAKFLQSLSPGDFRAKLKAYTYPEEFEPLNGGAVFEGLTFYEQPPKSFNLSYRTIKGNDVDGTELGYKLHFLYNILADPDAYSYDTMTDSSVEPIQFSWNLTGTPPVKIDLVRPTVHITLDSTEVDPETMAEIEGILYGTDETEPYFPDMDEIAGYFGWVGDLIIVDHGDGTWSAIGVRGYYINMISETEFEIDNVNATYSDADTFTVTDTHNSWV